MRTPQSAFTLIELSVVLIIIGLLAGGILVGQTVIRNAEIQSVIMDIGRYREAVGNFSEKYQALPGDMPDATTYWGTDPGGCPPAFNTVQKKETCNGDGNNWIGTNAASNYERFRAWQHLSNAGMVGGLYPGVAGASHHAQAVVGVNIPATEMAGVGIGFHAVGTTLSGYASYYDGFYGNFFDVGGESCCANYGPAFEPSIAYEIDSKLDDGLPGTGDVMSFKATSAIAPGCTTTDVTTTAAYSLSSTDKLCSLMVMLRF